MLGNIIGLNMFGGKSKNSSEKEPVQAEALPENIIEEKLKNLNIEIDDLNKEVPDFKFLSPGQKILALENLQQSILGEIKEEALSAYQGRFAKMSNRFDLHNAGVLGHNLWLGLTKHYQLAKIEKLKSDELISGGLEVHQEVLSKLTEGLKNYGPEVELSQMGELQINYLNKLDNLSDEEKELIEEFNISATALSKIPDEWRYETASESDKKKFAQAQRSYENNKFQALNILQKKKGSEERATSEMNKIDSQVRLNQFLNSNPDVEAQLLKIQDGSLTKKVLSGVIAERGLYMGAGFASRTFATLGLGALSSAAAFGGVVAGAGAVGYFRSLKRAKETIRQKDVLGRRGKEDEGELSKIFALGGGTQEGKVDTKNEISLGLGEKINSIITRLENEDDQDKKVELAERLKTRLEYTKKYLDNGAVNFGSKEERLNNQYNLMTALAQAETYLDLVDKDSQERKEVEQRVQDLIYSELDYYNKRLEQKRKEYVVKQARKGMMIAMGFATAGRIFSELVHGHGVASESEVVAEKPAMDADDLEAESSFAEPVLNNPELVDYLSGSAALKGNLDLKSELLNQKITVNVLTKGDSIGSYAQVTNNTPVSFVRPDGSVEVRGAGEVYVHPGDRVIQTADGKIYVVQDSGIKGTHVSQDILEKKIDDVAVEPETKDSYIDSDRPQGEVPDSVDELSHSEVNDSDINMEETADNSAPTSYIEAHKAAAAPSSDQSSYVKMHKPVVDNVTKTSYVAEKTITPEANNQSLKIPESFSKGDEVNKGLASQWNSLAESDQEIYNNFATNTSLYETNPDLAIAKFLGETPAEIIHEPGSSEIIATLKNGHTIVFDTEDNQIIMSVDGDSYDIIDPEKIIATRKMIQYDYVDASEPANNEVITNIDTDSNLWAARPNVKTLEFNQDDFTPRKEAQIQKFYDQRVEVLNEIKKQYAEIKIKYSDSPKFDRFQDVVKTFYAVESEKVSNIVEGAKDYDKFIFPIYEEIKEPQNPAQEVSERLERIAGRTLFKSEPEEVLTNN